MTICKRTSNSQLDLFKKTNAQKKALVFLFDQLISECVAGKCIPRIVNSLLLALFPLLLDEVLL